MINKILRKIKYWLFVNIKKSNFPIVYTLKEVTAELPPIIIGSTKLARGLKNVRFTEEELKEQGKIAVGKPISFLALGDTIAASNRALAKAIFFENLKANAYSTLDLTRINKGCMVTIQPYSI